MNHASNPLAAPKPRGRPCKHHVSIGDVFGGLTIVSGESHRRYPSGAMHRVFRTRCVCGRESDRALPEILRGGKCHECSTRKHWLKAGDRFGKLVIIEANRLGSDSKRYQLCRCDCGDEALVPTSSIVRRFQTTCGCSRKAIGAGARCWLGLGDMSKNLWNHVVRNARIRDIEVSIEMQDAWDLFQTQGGRCALTGVLLVIHAPCRKTRGARERHGSTNITASLDRIDSTKGYEAGNVQWVHKVVNIMKSDHSDAEFVEWCRAVAAHADRARMAA